MTGPGRPQRDDAALGTTVEVTLTLWFPTDDVAEAELLTDRILRPVVMRMRGGLEKATTTTPSTRKPPQAATPVARRVIPSTNAPERVFRRGPTP